MRKLPPLNALRVFETAARHGSFTAASHELNVTQGAVSQQVQLLECWLGVRLFNRTSRGVMLTAAARGYMRELSKAFDEMALATEQLLGPVPHPLTIGVLPTFGTRWLVPRLPAFQSAFPKIDIDLRISLQPVDFARDNCDAAIFHGRPPWPGLTSHFLFRQTLRPVCSPDLLRGPHPLESPDDLRWQMLLHVRREVDEWKEWLSHGGVDDIDTTRGLKFDSTKMALDAAIAGLGVALGRQPFIEEDIEEGRLVAPFDLQVTSKSAYYLVYPADGLERAPLQAFCRWLLAEVESHHQHRHCAPSISSESRAALA